MTHSYLTNGVQLTSDSSPRGNSRIDRFIVHHAATTSLAAILSLFQPGGRTVSANYALGNDGTLILAVDEDRRAWTSASSFWDGRAVTIEVANSVAGGAWPVSDVTFDKLARLIADVATRYNFPINDDTVLTHQELYIRYRASYATSCPGDLQRRKAELIGKANYYRAFPTTAGVDKTPIAPRKEYIDMSQITYVERVDDAGAFDGEWMIVGRELGAAPNLEFAQDGYRITGSWDEAQFWSRQYGWGEPDAAGFRKSLKLKRPAYIALQNYAREQAADHRRVLREALAAS